MGDTSGLLDIMPRFEFVDGGGGWTLESGPEALLRLLAPNRWDSR